jgi:predicted acyl esterase
MSEPGWLPPLIHAGMRMDEVSITMPDGVRLAANLFRPEAAAKEDRFPVLLEYLPYRKDDGLYERDWDLYSYLTANGYACVKVDIRGTGRSEGDPPPHEYSEIEHSDCDEVISWLAEQPWSTGAVGMWGISWGGFNSIQMAMRPDTPSALRAIVAVDASDQLFHDDVHYIDGMFHVDEYDVMIDLDMARSGAPGFDLDEAMLAARFDAPPWKLLWLKEQRDGPFWQRASLAPGYRRLRLPAYLIGGWYDGYRDSVFRMLANCTNVPVRALVGPWNHAWPHDSNYGPEVEWRADVVRWWDRWLRDEQNGIEDEPKLSLYVQRSYPPDPNIGDIPGRWRAEEAWPIEGSKLVTLRLRGNGTLGAEPGDPDVHELRYLPSGGAASGLWWGEVWPDQRGLDANALVYETPALERSLQVIGWPVAEFAFEVDAPSVNWFARLSDVAPDGSVTLVTGGGARSATIVGGETDPADLEPGRRYRMVVPLHATGWEFEPGHRIRLALSNAMWPMIWPTPYPCTTRVFLGPRDDPILRVPVVPASTRRPPSFPDASPPVAPPNWESNGTLPVTGPTYARSDATRIATAAWGGSYGTHTPWGSARYTEHLEWRVSEEDPATASCHGESETLARTGTRLIRWRGVLDIAGDQTAFDYRYRRELWLNGQLVREREWHEKVPRDHQ